jgi:ubiquinone/menaquinone biosynthesis C-methylase UbiE
MRVLDVGSGAGEVAFLAAEFVGEAGDVLGTDEVYPVLRQFSVRNKLVSSWL